MIRPVILFCVYMALTPFVVNAMTAEQKAKIHQHFEEVGMKCIQDNTITEEDIANMRGRKLPNGPNASCFLACMMKKIGVMDDKGMMQKESAMELAKQVFNEPEELNIIGDFLHACSYVNDESVNDGEKGCDRAVLAYTCMVDKAPKFGLDV